MAKSTHSSKQVPQQTPKPGQHSYSTIPQGISLMSRWPQKECGDFNYLFTLLILCVRLGTSTHIKVVLEEGELKRAYLSATSFMKVR